MRPTAAGVSPRGTRGRPDGGEQKRSGSSSYLRRAFAMLLLPLSLLPVVLLAPSLARAPATLVVRLERMVLPTQHPARSAPSPTPPLSARGLPPGA